MRIAMENGEMYADQNTGDDVQKRWMREKIIQRE